MRSLVALLLVGLCAACGTAGGGSSTGSPTAVVPVDPEEPVTSTPGDHRVEPGGGRPERVRPRPGMKGVRPIPWEKARQTPDGRSLRIVYWSGVEPCNVLDHVDVVYEPGRLVVTVFEGHDPSDEDTACIEIALQKVVRVPLEEAVDGRKIVDGAA